jgi:hypothetical protein
MSLLSAYRKVVRKMNKRYILELTDINLDYQDDVEGNIEELFYNIVEFADNVKLTDITDEEDSEE